MKKKDLKTLFMVIILALIVIGVIAFFGNDGNSFIPTSPEELETITLNNNNFVL